MSRTRTICFRIAIVILVLWLVPVVPGRSAAFVAPLAIWIWEEDAFSMLDKDETQREVETFLDRQHISIG